MVIKIVGGEQVVCDCRGDTTDTRVDRLLVGITESKDRVTIKIVCPECDYSMEYVFIARLILASLHDA